MMRDKSLKQTKNIEEIIRRTPPHLLSEHNKKHLNISESTSMSHPIGNVSTNSITKPSTVSHDQSGYDGSSSPLQDHSMHTRVVPQVGETKRYLYLPMLLSIISSKTSTSAPYEEGTHKGSDNEHLMSSHGGSSNSDRSNSRTADYHPPYQLSSFYPVAPYSYGNENWKLPQHQEPAHLQCNETGREEQLPLPPLRSSHDIHTNITSTMETSSSILGKRPAASNTYHSFFQQQRLPLDSPDMEPELTDDLFNLVQSLGTLEYLYSWEKIFGPGSLRYGPHHTSSLNAMAGSNGTAPEPSLSLG